MKREFYKPQDSDFLRFAVMHIYQLVKWVLLAAIIGAVCGLVGALFYNGVHEAGHLFEAHPQLLYALPVLGLLIVLLYRGLRLQGVNTDSMIDAARDGSKLRIELVPAIFIGTVLTHLGGGSSGREGAALQIGGSIGNTIGALLTLDQEEMQTVTMVGMAAFFSAIFGTPLTAAMFVVMFISIGRVIDFALLPCLLASVTAIKISMIFGVVPFHFTVAVPESDPKLLAAAAVLAVLAGIVSVIFCEVLHRTGKLYKKVIRNDYLRVLAGGILVILFTKLIGSYDYNGAGGEIIRRAIEDGSVIPYAWILKILFTAITLEAGFKGGEIVPTFFTGAAFGAFFGPILGIPAGFGAALGLIAAFAGATNTVIPSIFLSVEVFGSEGLIFFAIACILSYAVSGYNGLYSSQTILFSKARPSYVNIRTNHNDVKRHLHLKNGAKTEGEHENE